MGMVLIVGLIVFQDRRQTAEKTETPTNPAQAEEKTNDPSNAERMRERWQAGVKADRQSKEAQAVIEKLIAESKAKKKAEEAAYWKSRREWIENFPFQKTYHPTLTFDPETLNYDRLLKDEVTDFPRRDERYWEMKKLRNRHAQMQDFYKNPLRYPPEFDQIHHILTEKGLELNAIVWSEVYRTLRGYHYAAARDLEAQRTRRGKTWGKHRDDMYEGILGVFLCQTTTIRLGKSGLLNGGMWKIGPKRRPCGIV